MHRPPPLTIPQAAEYTNLSERYIQHLVRSKRIPYLKVGRLVRFDPADLDRFLADCKVEAAS